MRWDTRGQVSIQFNSYHSPPADLPVSEEPRNSRYQNVDDVASQTTIPPILPIELGTQFVTFDGRVFKFFKNGGSSALAEGNTLTLHTASDQDTLASSTDLYEVTQAAAGWTINQWRGYFLTINDGTGEGQTRRVAGNSATVLYLEEPLHTALAVADSDGLLWHPYILAKTGTGVLVPVSGIAIGTIAAGNYGWMQSHGMCEAVILEAVKSVSGFVCNSAATAGYAQEVGAGITLEDAAVFGTAYFAMSNNDVGTPVYLWGCVG